MKHKLLPQILQGSAEMNSMEYQLSHRLSSSSYFIHKSTYPKFQRWYIDTLLWHYEIYFVRLVIYINAYYVERRDQTCHQQDDFII